VLLPYWCACYAIGIALAALASFGGGACAALAAGASVAAALLLWRRAWRVAGGPLCLVAGLLAACHAAPGDDGGSSIAGVALDGTALTVDALTALKQFDDPVYLHQVVEESSAGIKRYADLPEALATAKGKADGREWRVHCHVPIFMSDLGAFSSTRSFISEVLAIHRGQPISSHLEVETYTWNVLPEHLRAGGMEQAIARELNWVKDVLAA